MPQTDLRNILDYQTSLGPAARTASANGTGVDLQNNDGAVCYFNVGTITDGTHTPKLQDSPDNSTFTDVVAAQLQGTFANLASNTNQEIGYVGVQRYVRAVITVSGATTGGVYAATIVRGAGRKQPI